MCTGPVCIILLDNGELTTSPNKKYLEKLIVVTSHSLDEICLSSDDPCLPEPVTNLEPILQQPSNSPKNISLLNNDQHTCMTLSGNVFSALIYLLSVNNTFRNSFLLKTYTSNKHSVNKSGKLAVIKVNLVMPERCEVGYKS